MKHYLRESELFRRSEIVIALYLFVFLILILDGCGTTSYSTHPSYPRSLRTITGTPSITFISDTQSPLWVEKLRLQSDHNEEATENLLNTIAHDSTCAAVFHLGDITGAGSDNKQWDIFDKQTQPLRNANIPLYPAFGNHEYFFSDEEGTYNTLVRFPFLRPSWYVRRVDSMAIILLNSNISKLSETEQHEQERWYYAMLDSLDRDSSVLFIIVGCHHSPYTNSTIVSPAEDVQKLFLPAFLTSKKTMLFISGHSHALEHFHTEGKDFLVTGGGGGLLHPLIQGKEQRRADMFQHRDSRSFFHFCRIERNGNSMTIDIHALDTETNNFKTAYSIQIPSKPQSANTP